MDKMREEFEDFMEDSHWSWASGDSKEELYKVWKASRSALCVELNSVVFSRDKNGDGGLMLPERVFKAMDEAGVSYK